MKGFTMARVIGIVKVLQDGEFFVKDAQGAVKQLKSGEEILENDLVYGAPNNPSNAQIVIDITIADSGDLTVLGSSQLHVDLSVIDGGFEKEEAVVAKEAVSDAWKQSTANANPAETQEATAAGALEEPAAGDALVDTERAGSTLFDVRSGAIGDVSTTLRDTVNGGIADVAINQDILDLNDQPIVGDVTGTINEARDGTNTITGQLVAFDADATDTHTFFIVDGSVLINGIAVEGISVVVNTDGTYEIVGDFNALAIEESATVTFQYYAVDDGLDIGAPHESLPATVTITINGTNDQPVIGDINVRGEGQAGSGIVGYYDMSLGEGASTQIAGIETAGLEDVQLFTLSAEELSNINVLYVQNGYGNTSEYLSHITDISQAVQNGMTLIIHDRELSQINDLLPGGNSFEVHYLEGNLTNIEIIEDGLETGIGGNIGDSSLDGGNYSNHGYIALASLPEGAMVLMTDGNTEHIVTFSYQYGSGTVIYSTIPLDHYLNGSGDSTINQNMQIYAANLLEDYVRDNAIFETHDEGEVTPLTNDGNNILSGLLSVSDDDVSDTHTFRVVEESLQIIDESNAGIDFGDVSVSITQSEEGEWQYNINGNFTKLAAGESATVRFAYVADDGHGFDDTNALNESSTSAPAWITLTITGTNDQPIISDVNINMPLFFNSENWFEVGNGLSMVGYENDGSVVTPILHSQGLGIGSGWLENDQINDQIGFRGNSAEAIVFNFEDSFNTATIELTSLNQASWISSAEKAQWIAYNDGEEVGRGVFNAQAGADIFTIHTLADFDSLRIAPPIDGEFDSFYIKSLDVSKTFYESHDNTDVVGVDDTTEDVMTSFSGTLLVSDDDTNDTHTFHVAEESLHVSSELVTDLGVSLDAETGEYSLSGNFNALAAGESATVSFQYYAMDSSSTQENGEPNTSELKTVTMTITGTNDQPVVSDVNVNSSTNSISGTELSQSHMITSSGEGSVGYSYFTVSETTTVTIRTDGPTTDPVLYLLRNDGTISNDDYIAHNDDGGSSAGSFSNAVITYTLAAGEYMVAVSDFSLSLDEVIAGLNTNNMTGSIGLIFTANHPIVLHDHNVNVIYESNDVTDVQGVDDTQEDVLTTFEGSLATVQDADASDTHTYSLYESATAPEGVTNLEVSVFTDGMYTVTGNFNALAAGESATITFQYYADDGRGFDGSDGRNESSISELKTVTMTITGTNDQPIISDVSYNNPLSFNSENWFTVGNGLSIVGYENDGSIVSPILHSQGLGVGTGRFEDSEINDQINFAGRSAEAIFFNFDDTFNTATIELTSLNQAGNYNSAEKAQWIAYSDGVEVDRGLFNAQAGADIFTIHTSVNFDSLRIAPPLDGESDSFYIKSLNVSKIAFEAENGLNTFTGTLAPVIDDDVTDTHVYTLYGNPEGIDVVVTEAGTYTVTGDFNYLAAGEEATVSFQYVVQDDSGVGMGDANNESSYSEPKTVTLTVTGTNDAPVITSSMDQNSGTSIEAGNEDAGLVLAGIVTVSGLLTASDVDTGATQTWSVEGIQSTTYGTFALNGNSGQWTYTLNNSDADTQALKETESAQETYTVRVTDDFGAYVDTQVIVTIQGTNDSPIVTSEIVTTEFVTVPGITYDTGNTSGVHVTAYYDNHSEHSSYVTTNGGNWGVDHGGSDSSQIDGNNGDDTIVFRFDNGFEKATIHLADWDSNDDARWIAYDAQGHSITGNYDGYSGTFVIDSSSSQSMGDIVEVRITANSSNDDFKIDSIVIAPTQVESSVYLDQTRGDVTEDSAVIASGILSASDVDADATQTWSIEGTPSSTYGTFALDGNSGHWTFTLDNTLSATQGLKIGQSVEETYTVRVTDDFGAYVDTDIKVTINGVNDIPDAVDNGSLLAPFNTDEGVQLSNINVLGNDTDPDNDALHVTNATSLNGDVAINPDGTLNFTPTAGFTGDTTISYSISDGNGGVDSAYVYINVVAVNHTPTIVVDTGNSENANDSVMESGLATGTTPSAASITAEGTFTIGDPDGLSDIQSITLAGTTFTIGTGVGEFPDFSSMIGETVTTTHGSVELTSYDNGVFGYSYVLGTLTVDVQGDIETDGFDVSVTDGTETAMATVTVNIVDDAPFAYDNYASLVEGTASISSAVTNLLFVLDFSGSMAGANLTAMKAAVGELAGAYDAAGGFNLKIVTFGTDAGTSAVTGVFSTAQSVTDWLATVDGTDLTGATNYDTAISTAMAAWTAANIAGADASNSISYFISDGAPSFGHALTSSEKTAWERYVDDNFTKSIAIGMGSGAPSDTDLQAIAYTPGGADEIYIVSNLSDLTDTLVGTVQPPITEDGNVVTQDGILNLIDIAGADGWASPKLVSVEHDGTTHTFTNAQTSFTIETDAGTVTINNQGAYSFTSLTNVANDISDTIFYTVADSDGSTAQAKLILSTLDSVPTAVADTNTAVEGYYTTGSENLIPMTTVVPPTWTPQTILDTGSGNSSNGWQNITTGLSSDAITIEADATHATTVSFTLGDTNRSGTATLYKLVSGPDIQISTATFASNNDNDTITFSNAIISNGTYYVTFTRENQPGQENVDISKVTYNTYIYTPATTTTTYVTQTQMDWVAASVAVGNVLENDITGTDSGLSVTSAKLLSGVDAAVVSGGIDIAGNNGILHIDDTGAYTYTPTNADMTSLALSTPDVFSYTITDADGSESTSTLTINVSDHNYSTDNNIIGGTDGDDTLNGTNGNDVMYGGSGSDTLMGNGGNDTLVFDAQDTLIDGGAGIDSIVLPQDSAINFTALDGTNNPVENIEIIDLTQNGTHELIGLSLDDIKDMTDSNNTLTILGDNLDSTNVPGATGNYSVVQSSEAGFDVYTYSSTSGDPTVILKIDTDIQHS